MKARFSPETSDRQIQGRSRAQTISHTQVLPLKPRRKPSQAPFDLSSAPSIKLPPNKVKVLTGRRITVGVCMSAPSLLQKNIANYTEDTDEDSLIDLNDEFDDDVLDNELANGSLTILSNTEHVNLGNNTTPSEFRPSPLLLSCVERIQKEHYA